MTWPCFYSTPTTHYQHSLRRYADSSLKPCPKSGTWGYHNAVVELEIIDSATQPAGMTPGERRADERFPKVCQWCGYEFVADDYWQDNYTQLWAGGGKEFDLRKAPIGAMWTCSWYVGTDIAPNNKDQPGYPLMVQTPDGEWHVDGKSLNGNGWTRTGPLDNLTVNPSIQCPRYHSWLHNSILKDDIDGRKYPDKK